MPNSLSKVRLMLAALAALLAASLTTTFLSVACSAPADQISDPTDFPLSSHLTLVSDPTQPSPTSSPSPSPTATSRPTPTPSPTATPPPPDWHRLWPGVDRAFIPVVTPRSPAPSYLYALRLDPAQVAFRVHFDPDQPRFLDEWQAEIKAPIIVNGGFFSGNNTPVGRIVVDGELFGYPLRYPDNSIGVPGLFAVLDGKPAIYALGHSDYTPRGMRFDQAVECYPILLLPGRQPAYPTETGQLARRTVIALDDRGFVVILLIDLPLFSLHQLSLWLAHSGLDLDSALNLDGGRSSGLILSLPTENRLIPSYVPVPIVMGIYPARPAFDG